MNELLDLLLFVARLVLVMYCVRHMLFLLTGTTRTYSEWSRGFGGFLYIGGVVLTMLHLELAIVPGRDVSRVMNAVGIALVVLPTVLRWLALHLSRRLENC
ncbi:hypothetical protein GO986_21770 [Deinococcus sp. HMF7620]|uniref:Uncharacterized protein n=1 Tax=Deinococcus arboris TaxID=2682977 RepID=A0A7C9HV13_9DEIO|nr:hypothetical protein [Deinococcus arboris]MVN89367.1 hypothetical protein [Deinococcus arboris]